MSIKDRTVLVLSRYWPGSLNAAAADLGVNQQSLFRVKEGHTASPQAWFWTAMEVGLGISREWFETGTGDGPKNFDGQGRPVINGVPSWRRAVHDLGLPAHQAELLLDLPFRPWRAAVTLAGGKEAPAHVLEGVNASLSVSLHGWADYFQGLRTRVSRDDLVKAANKYLASFEKGFPVL